MDAVTYPDASLKGELRHWVLQKVDITRDRGLADTFEVTAVPVAIAITADGQELGRLPNFVPAGEFQKWLEGLRH